MANKILVIDDTKVDLTEKKSSQGNDKTQYMTPAQIVSEGGQSNLQWYIDVVITDNGTKKLTILGGSSDAPAVAGTDISYSAIGTEDVITISSSFVSAGDILTTNLFSADLAGATAEKKNMANGSYYIPYIGSSSPGSLPSVNIQYYTSGGFASDMNTESGNSSIMKIRIYCYRVTGGYTLYA